MGRLAKNPGAVSNVDAATSLLLPGGSTALRTDSPFPGQTRYNTNFNKIEYWDGTEWVQGSSTGLVPIAKDTMTGTGVSITFTMSQTVDTEADVMVFVGGVYQNPAVAYTVDGSTTITFTSPPPNLETILVLHGYNRIT